TDSEFREATRGLNRTSGSRKVRGGRIKGPANSGSPKPNGSNSCRKSGGALKRSSPFLIFFGMRRREMLTKPRWEAEIRVMRNVFSGFVPFAVPGADAGFHGYLPGPRT